MVLQQILDARAEADELDAMLRSVADADYARVTQFKGYTIDDVLRHLHQGDFMAMATLKTPEAFRAILAERQARRAEGVSPRDDARLQFGHLSGDELRRRWHAAFVELCEGLAACDPDARLAWAGPDMGVRMFTTARQMEIWSHGQEIYDILGRDRAPTDRLRNIATIGVRTFGWTFVNRGLPVPEVQPHVSLTAPSGGTWEWNDPASPDRVTGSALAFAQVVTQVRNIADTTLTVEGDAARQWMAIAQCFAGPPEDPPQPGARFRVGAPGAS
ncbi:MAG: TIGR03084 family metal-binding protein [Hyphomicrobiaceae bacterium]